MKRSVSSKFLYTIGEVVEITKVPAHRIRYYESRGLISPPRRISNKRYFTKENIREIMELHYGKTKRNGSFEKSVIREAISQLNELLSEIRKAIGEGGGGGI